MRTFLNIVAFVSVFSVVLVWYGTHSRPFFPVAMAADVPKDTVKPVVSGASFDFVQVTDVFADNADNAGETIDLAVALIQQVENPSGDPHAVGDIHRRNKAYGVYQIRQPYLDDVNRIVGPEKMMEIWGVETLTLQDMVDDTTKAQWAVRRYLEYYGERYREKTHKEPTIVVYLRIHNGGPLGWRQTSTNAYITKAMRVALNAVEG